MISNHSGPCVTNVASCGLPFFRAIACRHMFQFHARRSAEPAAGRAWNQGSDLVRVALIDKIDPSNPSILHCPPSQCVSPFG